MSDGYTDGRKVESSAVFCLSRIAIALWELHSYTCEELSNCIFQSLSVSPWGIANTNQIFTYSNIYILYLYILYIKAYMPYTDPITSITAS